MSAPPRYPSPYGSTYKRVETDDEFLARVRAAHRNVEYIAVKTVRPRKDGESIYLWKVREQRANESDYQFWHRFDVGEVIDLARLAGEKLDDYVWQAFGMQRRIVEDQA